jgi:hypothetical protein
LLLVRAEARQRRDIISVMLVLWIISELFFWAVLNHHLGARRYLPIVPAVAILLVRQLGATRGNSMVRGWLLWPLVPAAAITLSVAVADCQLANSARTAAGQIAAKYTPTGHKLWFAGGYGAFQYYMDTLGGQRIDIARSLLQPGDVVVEPWCNNADVELPSGSVGWLEGLTYAPYSWMNPYGGTESTAAGFYSADLGPVPFAVGRLPSQVYFVVKVFSGVQYDSQPDNPREVQAGGIPIFNKLSYTVERKTLSLKPEVAREVQLAAQAEAEGKVAEAIQSYRRALEEDSNNPVVLNNLARILASASKPELRNGNEAVRLATRAVELTDYRQPLLMVTLATAYAEAGQLSRAKEMGDVGHNLALLTGQQDVADQIARLLRLYSSGKVMDATLAP